MKLRLSFSILLPLILLIIFSVKTFADDNVFDNTDFINKGYYALQDKNDKGIGSSSFQSEYVEPGPDNKNKVTVNSTGEKNIDGKSENYIEFSYGSKGGSNKDSKENRYVNFQMELDDKLRFNDKDKKTEQMIDGSNTNITYRGQNKKVIKLKDMKINYFDGRKIYSYNFSPGNYHSGIVTVRIYLKSNISYENAYNKNGSNPLINLYYKSGSNDYENKTISSPIYHVFQIAQTLRFQDVKNKVISEMNDNTDTLKQKIKNLFNGNPTDLDNLNNQVNNISKINNGKINGIYHLDQLISLKNDMSDNLEKSLHLLRLTSVPKIFNFNNASTNDGDSELSNENLSESTVGISAFNENNWTVNMKLSNLKNNSGNSLINTSFQINGASKIIKPNETFNYPIVNKYENGYIIYHILPIKINYTKGVMPSGKYTGTATWEISPKVNDNGIINKN